MAEPPDSGRVSPAIDAEREALLKVLVDHGVQFVVIGGAGIQSHGRRYDTLDIDVTPDRDEANLQRLADALNELDCRLVTDPANTAAWVPLPPDYFTPRSLLAATVWNLATRHGQLDLTFAPSGFPGGYGELAPRAEHLTVAGTRIAVLVAALADIHKSSARPTDLRTGRTSSPPVNRCPHPHRAGRQSTGPTVNCCGSASGRLEPS